MVSVREKEHHHQKAFENVIKFFIWFNLFLQFPALWASACLSQLREPSPSTSSQLLHSLLDLTLWTTKGKGPIFWLRVFIHHIGSIEV